MKLGTGVNTVVQSCMIILNVLLLMTIATALEPQACSVHVLSSQGARGGLATVQWIWTTISGNESTQVYFTLRDVTTSQYIESIIVPNSGLYTFLLSSELDTEHTYQTYVESADEGARTTICWAYGNFDVGPKECDGGVVDTIAGSETGTEFGTVDGIGLDARFTTVIAVDISPDDSFALVASLGNRKIYFMDLNTLLVEVVVSVPTNNYPRGVAISSDLSFAVFTAASGYSGKVYIITDLFTWAFSELSGSPVFGVPTGIALSADNTYAVVSEYWDDIVSKVVIATGVKTTIASVRRPWGLDFSPSGILLVARPTVPSVVVVDVSSGSVSSVTDSYNGTLKQPMGVAISEDESYFLFTDQLDNKLFKVDIATWSVVEYAGSGVSSTVDGVGSDASFKAPHDVAIRGALDYSLVVDYSGYNVRKVLLQCESIPSGAPTISPSSSFPTCSPSTPAPSLAPSSPANECDGGVVDTIAGSETGTEFGTVDGIGLDARFTTVIAVDISPDDSFALVASLGNRKIYFMDLNTLLVEVVVSVPTNNYPRGVAISSDLSFAVFTAASGYSGKVYIITDLFTWAFSELSGSPVFGVPTGIALSADNTYAVVSEYWDDIVSKVVIATGVKTTIASVRRPWGLDFSPSGILLVARPTVPSVVVVDVSSGSVSSVTDSYNGTLKQPMGVAISEDESYFLFTDQLDNKLFKVDIAIWSVVEYAGSGVSSTVDGVGSDASFKAPHDVAIRGALDYSLVVDYSGYNVRKVLLQCESIPSGAPTISPSSSFPTCSPSTPAPSLAPSSPANECDGGVVDTIAGSETGTEFGTVDGIGLDARFTTVIAVDISPDDSFALVASLGNRKIYFMDLNTLLVEVVVSVPTNNYPRGVAISSDLSFAVFTAASGYSGKVYIITDLFTWAFSELSGSPVFGVPTGIALSADNTYAVVSEYWDDIVSKVVIATGVKTTIASVRRPWGLDFSPSGILLVARPTVPSVVVVDVSSGSVSSVTDSYNGTLKQPMGVAISEDESYFLFTDQLDNKLFKVDIATWSVVEYAGSGVSSTVDGVGSDASFKAPHDVAIRGALDYSLVVDYSGYNVRKVLLQCESIPSGAPTISPSSSFPTCSPSTPAPSLAPSSPANECDGGVVDTIAGSETGTEFGTVDGIGLDARFTTVIAVDISPDDSFALVASLGNRKIYFMDLNTLLVEVVVSVPTNNYPRGVAISSDLSFAVFTAASGYSGKVYIITDLFTWAFSELSGSPVFGVPTGIALSADNTYAVVSEYWDDIVSKVVIATGVKTTIASVRRPWGLDFSPSGILLVARPTVPSVVVVDVSSGSVSSVTDSYNGTLKQPMGVAISEDESYFLFTDQLDNTLFKVDIATWSVVEYAGSGVSSTVDGVGSDASFKAPHDVAIRGALDYSLVVDYSGYNVRKVLLQCESIPSGAPTISPSSSFPTCSPSTPAPSLAPSSPANECDGGVVDTIAGSETGTEFGTVDGIGLDARFTTVIAVDISPDDSFALVASLGNRKIYFMDLNTLLVEVVVSVPTNNYPRGVAISSDLSFAVFTAASGYSGKVYIITDLFTWAFSELSGSPVFGVPTGIALSADNTYAVVSEYWDDIVSKVVIATGVKTTIASVRRPWGLDFSPSGILLVARPTVPSVVVVDVSSGSVSSVTDSYNGTLKQPMGVAISEDESYFLFTDQLDNTLFKVDIATWSVVEYAGSGVSSTVDGVGSDASFKAPHDVAIRGALDYSLVVDYSGYNVRKVLLQCESIPSGAPTISPSSSFPTCYPSVSETVVCLPGDREYCNNRGFCSPTGEECVCDDFLHYWPSERCATWHDGRELEDGWFCYPNTVDQYCSWMGVCDSSGLECLCFDYQHRSTVDRCLTWFPAPTPSPAVASTEPTVDITCVPGDRKYCNNRGFCSPTGEDCVCDDFLHYWPSERCATWHDGRELEDGWFCYPNTVDQYCSWMGVCDSSGLECICQDSEHRSSTDRCSTWSPVPTPRSVATPHSCTPDSRSDCNNRGRCHSDGKSCVCDDPLHYWPSEMCSTYHHGSQLEESQCCTPNSIDYYCAWMGVCDSTGSKCICNDPDHRIASERCQYYHDIVPYSPAPSSTFSCPELMSIGEHDSFGNKPRRFFNSDNSVYWLISLIAVITVLAVVVAWVLVSSRHAKNVEGTSHQFPERNSFQVISPYYGNTNLGADNVPSDARAEVELRSNSFARLRSTIGRKSLQPFNRSSVYEEFEDTQDNDITDKSSVAVVQNDYARV